MGHHEQFEQPTDKSGNRVRLTRHQQEQIQNAKKLSSEIHDGNYDVRDILDEKEMLEVPTAEQLWSLEEGTDTFVNNELDATTRSSDVVRALIEHYKENNHIFAGNLENTVREYLPRAMLGHYQEQEEKELATFTQIIAEQSIVENEALGDKTKAGAQKTRENAEKERMAARTEFRKNFDVATFVENEKSWLRELITKTFDSYGNEKELSNEVVALRVDLSRSLESILDEYSSGLYTLQSDAWSTTSST